MTNTLTYMHVPTYRPPHIQVAYSAVDVWSHSLMILSGLPKVWPGGERENGSEREKESGRKKGRDAIHTEALYSPTPHLLPHTHTQQVQELCVPCIINFWVMSATILSSARPSLGLLGAISTLKTGSQCQEHTITTCMSKHSTTLYTDTKTAYVHRV